MANVPSTEEIRESRKELSTTRIVTKICIYRDKNHQHI